MRSVGRRAIAFGLALAACSAPTAVDGGREQDSPVTISACESAVDALITRCAATPRPDGRRLCALRAYRDACTSRPDAVASIAACLTGACSTVRDPSATSCVAGVIASGADDAHTALYRAWCSCSPSESGCPDRPSLTGGELVMLGAADARSTTTCLGATCTMPSFCFGSSALGAALLQCDMVAP